jgi:hypothetical protein
MRVLTSAARRPASALAVVLALGVAANGAGQAAARAAGAPSGSCDPYVDGTVIPVPCSAISASAGSNSGGGKHGSAGGSTGGGTIATNTCATTVLDQSQAQHLGLSWPPPIGHSWALMLCLGGVIGAGPQVILVEGPTGAPAVTPRQLLVTALGELRVPHLDPATAPPRGRPGLVGLPEWFWIAASSWHARTVTVTAGPVWATVTATPLDLTFQPGAGHPVTCTGPGTAYDPREPAAMQRSACSFTYLRPSAGQAGNAYSASVTVNWRVSWTGSGGVGGILDAALPVAVSFSLPVAQGEALVTSS